MTQNNLEKRDWYLFDANQKVLGRLATEVAVLLRGKNKVGFANHLDGGDYVVITNAKKIVLTGNKEEQKRYYHHTGYLGNLKTMTVPELRKDNPEKIIEKAVYGMLPSNKLRDGFMARLKVYAGPTHPHVNIEFVNAPKGKE